MSKILNPLLFLALLALPFIQSAEAARIVNFGKAKTLGQYYGGFALGGSGAGLLEGREIIGVETRTYNASGETSFAWKAFAGFRYKQYVNFELAYQDFGEFEQAISIVDAAGKGSVSADTTLAFQALTLEVRPHYRIGDYMHLQALAGLAYSSVDRRTSSTFNNFLGDKPLPARGSSDSSIGLLYGFGFEYVLVKKFAARLEFNFTDSGDEPIKLVQLAFIRNFDTLPFLKH